MMKADGELLRAYSRAGDEEAFAELVRRHGGLALAAARHVLSGTTAFVDAEDAAQAALIALARRAGDFTPDASVAGWVYAVARRTALKLARDHATARRHEARAAAQKTAAAYEVATEERPLRLEEVEAALAGLPDRWREPLLLYHKECLSRAEAAARMGLSEDAFAARLKRGRAALRAKLLVKGVWVGAGALAVALGEIGTAAETTAAFVATTTAALGAGAEAGAGGTATISSMAVWAEGAARPAIYSWKAAAVLAGTLAVGGATTLSLTPAENAPPPPAVAVPLPEAQREVAGETGATAPTPTPPAPKRPDYNLMMELYGEPRIEGPAYSNPVSDWRDMESDILRGLAERDDWVDVYLGNGHSGRYLTDRVMERLAELPNLRRLTMGNYSWFDGEPPFLLTEHGYAQLARMTQLQRVTFTWLNIGDKDVAALAQCPNLTHVDISSTIPLTDAALAALGTCAKLKVLDLAYFDDGIHQERPVTFSAEGLGPLTRCSALGALLLDLDERVGDAAIDALLPLPRLLDLRLGHADLSDDAVVRAVERWPQLFTFQSHSRRLGRKTLEAIASLPSLMGLRLERAPVTDLDLEALRGHNTLQFLTLLGADEVGDAGLAALATCPWLHSLFLSGRCVTDAGLAAFLDARPENTIGIDDLHLESPLLGDEVLRRLARAPRLKFLELPAAHLVTDEGVQALAALERLGTLVLPEADRLTDRSLEALGRLPRLRHTNLSPNARFTREGVAEFNKTLPNGSGLFPEHFPHGPPRPAPIEEDEVF